MRRTSALKKRIDHLSDDVTNLRDIILVLTRSYKISQDQTIVQRIEHTLCHGKWSYLPELLRSLEEHAYTTDQQPPSMLSFSGTQPTTADGIVPVYPATLVPSSWMPVRIPPVPSEYVDNFQADSFYSGANSLTY